MGGAAMEEVERLRAVLASVTRERDALSERAQQLANDLRHAKEEGPALATAYNALLIKLTEAERAANLNLQLLRDARRERDEAIRLLSHQRDSTLRVTDAMLAARRERDEMRIQLQTPQALARLHRREPAPAEGHVEMHNGATLFWRTEKAHGGRVYVSDEIPTGVNVWDTALVSHSTLCEAMAVEFGLQAAERRDAFKAKADEHRARSQASADGPDVPDGPESAGFAPGFEQRAANFVTAGMAAQAAVDALTTPCPTCGALGCRVPCQLLARLQASWNKGSASE